MGKPLDIAGKRFGNLVAVERIPGTKNGSCLWRCKCDCGNTTEASARDLNNKRITSCGCNKGLQRHLEGQKFGNLTVIRDTGKKQKNVKLWLCQCECGNTTEVRTDCLTGGLVISCGCVAKGKNKIDLLKSSRKLEDHTSEIFFKGTVSKNSITGVNGVTRLKNGKYRAYIGYKNKTYYLTEDYDIEVAKIAREEAEKAVKEKRFDEWISKYKNNSDRRKG